ncbi:Eukaryotic translation initiation factor isoform 4E [Orobanche gracilis]
MATDMAAPTSELQAEAPAMTALTSELQAEVPSMAEKQPHKLERKWTFWYDNQSKPKQGAAWGTSLRKAYTFDTVEEFWWCELASRLVLQAIGSLRHGAPFTFNNHENLYDQIFRPSKFPASADFHLFIAGVEPKWEDPECANGGKWTATSSSKTNLDNMWLETLLALIGEQFDDADEICGVVASVRPRQDKLSLWTKTAANEAAQVYIMRYSACRTLLRVTKWASGGSGRRSSTSLISFLTVVSMMIPEGTDRRNTDILYEETLVSEQVYDPVPKLDK